MPSINDIQKIADSANIVEGAAYLFGMQETSVAMFLLSELVDYIRSGVTSGTRWYSVTGTPDDNLGVDGDYCVNDSKVFYKKINGSWVEQFSITDGATGEGVPTGGTTGQFLQKTSDSDYDTEWADVVAAVAQLATGVSIAQSGSVSLTCKAVIAVYEMASGSSEVPAMTSATTPSGVVTASSNPGGYEAWKVFDASSSSYWNQNGYGYPQWVCYQFPAAKTIESYTILSTNDYGYNPRSWLFQGSSDGSNWTTLDSRTGYSSTGWGSAVTFSIASPGSYTYYRLYVTADNSGATGYANIYALTLTGVGQYTMLIPGTDYSITRNDVNGSQSHTITRLKTGTKLHAIDYMQ